MRVMLVVINGVKNPGPIVGCGDPVVAGPLPGLANGSMGLIITVGDASGRAKGSMGLMIVPTSLGAIRMGIASRHG